MNFFSNWKRKKMIKKSSSFIIDELAEIVIETVDHFEKEGNIKNPTQKEGLKLESTIFVFWLFQKSNVFPNQLHKLINDEIHDQYFEKLRKHGYEYEKRKRISEEFNARYKTYNELFPPDGDPIIIALSFAQSLAEKSKVDLDKSHALIPYYLIEKTTPKFQEWRKVTF